MNRSPKKAEILAEECGFQAVPFARVKEEIMLADAVFSCVGMPEPLIHKSDLDRDFSLEVAELEIVLETRCDSDLSFEAALRSALGASGNSYLFPFPADSFHITASHVAAGP